MNQVKQTAVVKAVREKKLMVNTRVMSSDSEDDSNDVVLAFITSAEEYMQTSGQLQHAKDKQ